MIPVDTRPDAELELSDYVRILRRRWIWVVASVVTVLALALVVTLVQRDRFQASAKVSLGNSAAQEAVQGGAMASGSAALRELSNEVDVALSDAVRDEVVAQLGAEPDVAIEAEDESDALRFTATAPHPDEAAAAANTWAQVYVDTKRRQAGDSIAAAVEVFESDLSDLRDQRRTLREPLDDLEDRLAGTTDEVERATIQAELTRTEADLRTELDVLDARIEAVAQSITDLEVSSRLASTGTATVVQVAAPPQQSSNASLPRNLVLATIVGVIVGAAAALLAENLDRTIKTAEDMPDLGVPILGEVPVPGREIPESELALATMRHAGTPLAEAYQKIRTAVQFALLGRRINSVLITSANQAEGKSTLSTNLAWALSAVDHRVALVDVDFRRPRLHKVFDCPQVPGLSDHLLSGTPLIELALRVDEQGSRNLIVLPAGSAPPNPADFVASPSFASVVRRIESEADLVVLDAPPVLPVSDAISISREVDAVVLLVRAGETTRDEVVEAFTSLRQVGAEVIGTCLVGVRESSSYYRYYRPDQEDGKRGRLRAGPIDLRLPAAASSTAPSTSTVGRPGATGTGTATGDAGSSPLDYGYRAGPGLNGRNGSGPPAGPGDGHRR